MKRLLVAILMIALCSQAFALVSGWRGKSVNTSKWAYLDTSALNTTDEVYSFPDKSGTFAILDSYGKLPTAEGYYGGSSGGGVWGAITGDITTQTDLMTTFGTFDTISARNQALGYFTDTATLTTILGTFETISAHDSSLANYSTTVADLTQDNASIGVAVGTLETKAHFNTDIATRDTISARNQALGTFETNADIATILGTYELKATVNSKLGTYELTANVLTKLGTFETIAAFKTSVATYELTANVLTKLGTFDTIAARNTALGSYATITNIGTFETKTKTVPTTLLVVAATKDAYAYTGYPAGSIVYVTSARKLYIRGFATWESILGTP